MEKAELFELESTYRPTPHYMADPTSETNYIHVIITQQQNWHHFSLMLIF